MTKSISEKLENVLLSALWAFRAYGNQNGFKDQNKYAEVEIEKIKAFIQSKISEAIAAERKELREKVEGMKTYTGGSSVNEKDKRVNKQEVLSLLEEK